MPIQLPDVENQINTDSTESKYYEMMSKTSNFCNRLMNSIRFYNISIVNFMILMVLGFFLSKLTTKYTELYMKNSLITIIVSNLVLYGISDTLAQSISSYNPNSPMVYFSFDQLDNGDIVLINEEEYNDANSMDGFSNYLDEDASFNESIQGDHLDFRNSRNFNEVSSATYFKFNRLAGFMCWGFIMAFVQCMWYNFLNIYSKDPKFITVLEKVLSDQLFFSPISLFCFFCYGTMVLENKTFEDTKVKLEKIYFKTLLINFSVWVPVQFINFLLVPRNYQVPFSSSISVLWNCFLSIRNSSA